jgi:ferrous-iron efflux pump FieF
MATFAQVRTADTTRNAWLMRAATYASVTVAATLIAAKIVAWMLTDSVSVLSSLIDSLLDAAAAVVNLIAVHHALTPADREHRFGHGKAEPLAGLAQAAFIAGSSVLLLLQAGHRLVTPQPIAHGEIGIAVMLFAIALTFGLVAFQRYVVAQTKSVAISADSLHYRGDVLLNGSVILSLVLSMWLGFRSLDPIFGAAIGVYILFSAYQIARLALDLLMDRELPDIDRARIREIALKHPGVRNVHDMRSRSAGTSIFIQMHLEMDGAISLRTAHEITDAVEAKILAAFPNAEVIIHEDPEGVIEPRRTFAVG